MMVSALFLSSPFLALLALGCVDNEEFVDENGYTCKGWYGYDCSHAETTFEYSSEGVADLLENCPKQCGTCEKQVATWGSWLWKWAHHNEEKWGKWWGHHDSSDDDNCKDDKWFWDERGYRCEDWQGFVCEDATADFEYSLKGQNKILEACKRSCGTCDGISPNCKNNYDFHDFRGYSCADWQGYDCLNAIDWGYSQTDFEDILMNCRRTCETCEEEPLPSLAGLVASVPDLSTLLTAVDIAGLVDTLSGDGTFTVFAPTNDAFAMIPPADLNALLADPEKLKQVILYHVLASTIVSGDLKMGETKVDTVSGGALWVTRSKDGVTVANSDRSVIANVIAADNLASNGVAHIIDAVLLPPMDTGLPSLAGLVESVDDLSTLLTAVQIAGLVETLDGDGTFTVFAPTNDAFAQIPPADLNALLADPAQLKQVLLYHVLASVVLSGDLKMGETKVDTASGGALWVTRSDDGVTVANSDRSVVANVIAADNLASNGVAHIIDAVLLPPIETLPSLAGLVASVDELSTLLTAVDKAGLVDTLSGDGTFTVFAPNNAAFAKIPPADLNALLADTEQLKQVLLYHVLASTIVSGDLKMGQTKVETASGGALWVTRSDEGVTVANSDRSVVANVIAADNLASNGVAHIIDAVLLPPINADLPSLAGLVASVDDLSTLLAAVQIAGLVDTLSGDGTFTVFAPNNAAFAKIPTADLNALLANPEQLKEVILYHVLASTILSGDLKMGETKVDTASGGALWVTKSDDGGVTVANSDRSVIANVIAADNLASNGVAHIIDAVLLPPTDPELPSLAGLVSSVDDLSTLLTAVDKAGLVDTLSGDGTFTVFAPNNAAFAEIPTADLNALLADTELLKQVILYHVLASTIVSGDLRMGETKVDTASGGALWVTKTDDGSVTVANSDRSIIANVIAADNLASNGVAHIIDTVLLPPAGDVNGDDFLSFEGFKDLCAAINGRDQCKSFGCSYNQRKGRCQIKKRNKVKCKKIQDPFTCFLVGCTAPESAGDKCSGTPFGFE